MKAGGARCRVVVIVVAAFFLAALGSCTRARARKVRTAESSQLCAKRLLIALEKLDDPGVPLLVGALDEQAKARRLDAKVIESPVVHNLRHPGIAGPLTEYVPEALLIINVWESTAYSQNLIPTHTEIRFGVSFYEFTAERNLIEVWKAELGSTRSLTRSHTITVDQANVIADELLGELSKSGLIFPCEKTANGR